MWNVSGVISHLSHHFYRYKVVTLTLHWPYLLFKVIIDTILLLLATGLEDFL